MSDLARLPPLQCLVHFEAAARLHSFTAAANEMGTTQPAVSQRIGELEADLGVPLFRRLHRGVTLTADGTRLYDAVRGGLGLIHSASAQIRSHRTRAALTVMTDFGFATYWLMPRLAALRELIPELDVRILTSQQEIDIRGEAVDVAIRFGAGHWPGCDAQMLFPEVVVPVCSPAFLAQPGRAAPSQWPLLHLEHSGKAPWLTWDDWFAAEGGGATASVGEQMTFNNYPLVIQGAVAGQGVALGWRPFVDALVRGGQLVAAGPAMRATAGACYLVRPGHAIGLASTPLVDRFCRWVAEECRAAFD